MMSCCVAWGLNWISSSPFRVGPLSGSDPPPGWSLPPPLPLPPAPPLLTGDHAQSHEQGVAQQIDGVPHPPGPPQRATVQRCTHVPCPERPPLRRHLHFLADILADRQDEDRLVHMQAVLGLVEDD